MKRNTGANCGNCPMQVSDVCCNSKAVWSHPDVYNVVGKANICADHPDFWVESGAKRHVALVDMRMLNIVVKVLGEQLQCHKILLEILEK